MNHGTGDTTEFDDVRHGYAPPRQRNRVPPVPKYPETRPEDVALEFPDARFAQSGEIASAVEADDADPGVSDGNAFADISDRVHTLIDSGKAAYDAEIALLKARADVITSAAKGAAVFVSLAAAAGLVTLLAIGFGAIIILADYLTNLQAVAIVVVALVLLTAIAGWLAKRQFDRITTAIWERTDG